MEGKNSKTMNAKNLKQRSRKEKYEQEWLDNIGKLFAVGVRRREQRTGQKLNGETEGSSGEERAVYRSRGRKRRRRE